MVTVKAKKVNRPKNTTTTHATMLNAKAANLVHQPIIERVNQIPYNKPLPKNIKDSSINILDAINEEKYFLSPEIDRDLLDVVEAVEEYKHINQNINSKDDTLKDNKVKIDDTDPILHIPVIPKRIIKKPLKLKSLKKKISQSYKSIKGKS